MPREQTQISVSSGFLIGSFSLEPGHHPSSSVNCPIQQQPTAHSWYSPLALSPVWETMEDQRGLWGLCGCCFVNPPILTPSSPLLTFFCIFPLFFCFLSLFGSTFPFSVSSSSCHKEPPFSPERRLPVPHCNPITYLTEECVIPQLSNRKSCAQDRSPSLSLFHSHLHMRGHTHMQSLIKNYIWFSFYTQFRGLHAKHVQVFLFW